MAIKEKDIKLLWGRSGNRCTICRTRLSQDSAAAGAYPVGEQAHIVGAKEDAPRGKSVLTPSQRDSYHNLILLCPNHHTEIDKAPADWPVDKLHQFKSEHELWVEETLSEKADRWKLAEDVVVTSIIDAAVELCDLERWTAWTSGALSPDPKWTEERPDQLTKFRERVLAAIWPEKYDELRRSTTTLAVLSHRAAEKFLDNAQERNGKFVPIKFYKDRGWNPNYERDVEKYEAWVKDCHRLVRESTKAVNWFASVVRRDVNPMFFATQGHFLVHEGPFMEDFSFQTRLLVFTQEEQTRMPEALFSSSSKAPPG